VAAFEHTHGREKADAGAKAGTADAELAGEFALGWETAAGFHLATGDEGANVLDDLHGELAVRCDVFLYFFFHAEQTPYAEIWKRVTR
jgi:hypothetical protein